MTPKREKDAAPAGAITAISIISISISKNPMVGTTSTYERPPLATHRKKASEASDDTMDTEQEGDIIIITLIVPNRAPSPKIKTAEISTRAAGTYTGERTAFIFIAIPAFRSPNGRGVR
jgi:hypothetical protein